MIPAGAGKPRPHPSGSGFGRPGAVDGRPDRLVDLDVPGYEPVSSRGQDTWFSATGPGFESPYRYHHLLQPAIRCPTRWKSRRLVGFELHRSHAARVLILRSAPSDRRTST